MDKTDELGTGAEPKSPIQAAMNHAEGGWE